MEKLKRIAVYEDRESQILFTPIDKRRPTFEANNLEGAISKN